MEIFIAITTIIAIIYAFQALAYLDRVNALAKHRAEHPELYNNPTLTVVVKNDNSEKGN